MLSVTDGAVKNQDATLILVRLLALMLLTLWACTDDPVTEVVLHGASDLPEGLLLATRDLETDLTAMGAEPLRRNDEAECSPFAIRIQVLAEPDGALPAQGYRIEDERCENGRLIRLIGGSLLSQQWAVYDLARSLGVRYFHPEQTYHPQTLSWPEDLSRTSTPFFGKRSMNVRRTHPVELSAPLDPEGLDMAGYQRRWIDWAVKTRHSRVNGWDEAFVGTYAFDRGFPRSTAFNLLDAPPGGRPLLDPDDPRTEEAQMTAAIEARVPAVGDLPRAVELGFQSSASEFTEADDQDTVRRLTFIADYMAANHPDVSVHTINHGTDGFKTPFYDVRFFDLPQFAPANLGVQVHTQMFYDLMRAAPVYGNDDFSHMLEWLRREATKRPIIHHPESSWWLTFDLPVPLYLAPATIEARAKDIELLRGLVTSDEKATEGVIGHHLFTSGQEWGYWFVDWCVAQMTWDAAVDHRSCVEQLTSVMKQGARVAEILAAVEARQVEDMRDPELIRFLVGSDDETEIAWEEGIRFHPLPPSPEAVAAYEEEAVAALRADSLEPLREMAMDYHGWAAELAAMAPEESEAVRPWLVEIQDGLEAFALRAEHAVQVYETVLDFRTAQQAGDLLGINAAFDGVDASRALTEAATAVVRRREAAYRYPDELTIDGDETGSGDEVENRTAYPYRYLSRTHRMFYWARPDQQLADLFGAGLDIIDVERRIITSTSAAVVRLRADEVLDLRVDWGDGTVDTTTVAPHLYDAEGFYSFSLDASIVGGVVHHDDRFAVVDRRFVFPKRSLKILEPEGAVIIENLLPGFVAGLGDDSEAFVALGRLDDAESSVAVNGSLQRRPRVGTRSGPLDFMVELRNLGFVTVRDADMRLFEEDPPRLTIEGQMETQQIIDLLVGTGGVDEEGARNLVAGILDFTPERLPEIIDFVIEAEGR